MSLLNFLSPLRRLLSQPPRAARFEAPLAPDAPCAVIGDVHGRDDLLARLLEKLEREAPDHRRVLVGDYIDRGEDSRGVLERLQADPELICLKGNHEAMCLAFLEAPERQGPRWLRNGGLQTLASYGVGLAGAGSEAERLVAARDRLAEALGAATIDWLASLPLIWRSGNVAVVHAAADPSQPIQLQTENTLLWGHPGFETRPREDGLWIVHGHTITAEPSSQAGRISVDTGAYASGRLTAALIGPGELRFVEAAPD